jgi:rhomboid protease GluP
MPVPVLTYGLIAVNVAMYALEELWSGGLSDETRGITLLTMGANVGRVGLLVEPWRLLSSAFLHGGGAHLVMNMWALYVLGSGLERLLGWSRLLTLYAAAAFSGSLLSALMAEMRLSVGASGAVWGLMVAELVWILRLRRRYGREMASVAQLAQPLVINVLVSFLPGIDFAAHLGGGFMGAALALCFPVAPGADERRWRPWAILGAVLMAASVMTAILNGRPWELIAAR